MAKRGRPAKLVKNKQSEMPLTGEGVEKLHIQELEDAADAYVDARDARMAKGEKEVAAKQTLQSLMDKHRADLPKDETDEPFYIYGDRRIHLVKEGESVKVTKVPESKLQVSDE